ncbi:50S ribosome-binding GTPase [Candidatus Acetothermia bacterium]|jgi:ribosome-interacting GTPase 1|nr:50S ribosome-binding GTPase [Candidatus Acetothermia bacterium]MCI2427394.1 50S ribosome-binding GTPase [Candidatus Acetothermia bacterium]MCI2428781.1 50S ribosome-binding GTPase [Candidatus Acetothermia bacterium]
MPANLTADFLKARERFQQASTDEEKLDALQEMLVTIPKHKGTEKMCADIKRRIAKLKEQEQKSKKGRSSGPESIEREGAGQVVLIGPPNTGKSSLLAYLTNAKPNIADYPFSSLLPVPGMMAYQNIAIQIIDLPPISVDHSESWVYNIIRNADLAIIVVAADDQDNGDDPSAAVTQIIEQLALRHTLLVRKRSGETDWRRVEVPALIVLNKCDLARESYVAKIIDRLASFLPVLPVSTVSGMGMDKLPEMIFSALNILRIYTKLPGKDPDLAVPYTLPIGSVVLDAINAVHREFAARLKFVRIWGSGKFDGQKIPTDHILQDGDIVEIHCF